MAIQNISVTELEQLRRSGKKLALIDVVPPSSFEEWHVDGSVNTPLKTLNPNGIMQLRGNEAKEALYVICQVGIGSIKACQRFEDAGFENSINVEGGKLAWEKAGLPLVRGKKTTSADQCLRMVSGVIALLGSILTPLVHPAFITLPLLVGGYLLFSGLTQK